MLSGHAQHGAAGCGDQAPWHGRCRVDL